MFCNYYTYKYIYMCNVLKASSNTIEITSKLALQRLPWVDWSNVFFKFSGPCFVGDAVWLREKLEIFVTGSWWNGRAPLNPLLQHVGWGWLWELRGQKEGPASSGSFLSPLILYVIICNLRGREAPMFWSIWCLLWWTEQA